MDVALNANHRSSFQNGLVCLSEENYSELRVNAREYLHQESQVKIIVLQSATLAPFFGITFYTPPTQAAGIAHIVEHLITANTRKFPAIDTFTDLELIGSGITAATYFDSTSYSASARDLLELRQQLAYILDFSFFPVISDEALEHNCTRIERINRRELSATGVLYNELRPLFGTLDRELYSLAGKNLFGENLSLYTYDGDPQAILDLTREQIVDYHQRYYQPNNATIVIAGSKSVTKEVLEETNDFFNQFKNSYPRTNVSADYSKTKITTPKKITASYNPTDVTDKPLSLVGHFWSLPNANTATDFIALELLDQVLIKSQNSPLSTHRCFAELRRTFEISSIGALPYVSKPNYAITMSNESKKDLVRGKELILKTLKILGKGIDPKLIRAAIEQVRINYHFSQAEMANKILEVCPLNLRGASTLEFLKEKNIFAKFARSSARGNCLLTSYLNKFFVDNPERADVILVPSYKAEPGKIFSLASEQQILRQRECRIKTRTAQNYEDHSIPFANELPESQRPARTNLSALSKSLDFKNTVIEAQQDFSCYLNLEPEREISRLTISLNLSSIPLHLQAYCELIFKRLCELPVVGQDEYKMITSYETAAQIYCSSHIISSGPNSGLYLNLNFSFFNNNLDKLFKLLDLTFSNIEFQKCSYLTSYILSELNQSYQMLMNNCANPNTLSLGALRLRAHFDRNFSINDSLEGFSSYQEFFKMYELSKKNPEQFYHNLKLAFAEILNLNNLKFYFSSATNLLGSLDDLTDQFHHRKASKFSIANKYDFKPREAFAIPLNFSEYLRGVKFSKNQVDNKAALILLARYVQIDHLYKQLYEFGGSYRQNCSFDLDQSLLVISTSRNPNLTRTFEILDNLGLYIRNHPITGEELKRIKAGVLPLIPILHTAKTNPSDLTNFINALSGYHYDQQQLLKEQIMQVSLKDFFRATVALDALVEHGDEVLIATQQVINQVNKERKAGTKFSVQTVIYK